MPSSAINKILIVGPSWIGDMVMAQSLFITLKKQNPGVSIDVLALAWTKPLLERMPEVNKAITMPVSHGQFGWKMRKNLGHELKQTGYDQAIVLPNSWKSALIPWFAGIPVRTGWKGEIRYGLINDIRQLDKQALPLMVQRYVSLAYPASQSKTAPDYPIPKMVANSVVTLPPMLSANQKRLILCPGAEFGPAKQWPTTHYADLAKSYLEQGWQILILGSEADRNTGNEISSLVNDDNLFNLCGETKLDEAIDILATADQVVSNDSGLMHIAAALQKPLVAIYGPTSPNFTPPLAPTATIAQTYVDCGPCFQRDCPEKHHNCMRKISSEHILRLIKDNN